MESNVSKLLSMLQGSDRNMTDITNVSPDVRAKINDALESLFLGRSLLLWVDGGDLLAAWTRALDDMRDELFKIPNNSPVVEYLRIAVFEHRTRWNNKMLISNERKSIAQFNNETEKAELCNHANMLIRVGRQTIYDIINATPDTDAQRKVTYEFSRPQNTRTHDNTHERERTHKR